MTTLQAWLAAGIVSLAMAQAPAKPRQSLDLGGYRLAELELTGVTAFPVRQLLDQFPIRAGDSFDVKAIRQGLDRLKRAYEESGHIDVAYIPYQDLDHAKKTVSLAFDVLQGPQYLVNRIEWAGPSDRVTYEALRAACALEEGNVYRPSLVEKTIAAVNRLGVFRELTRDDWTVERSRGRAGYVDVQFRLKPRD